MFEGISEKLGSTLKRIGGYGKLSEKNIEDALREVRLNLLEADVNFRVVREFVGLVKQRALGREVEKSLNPGQQFVKIVKEELTRVLGETSEPLGVNVAPPLVIMLVGLQGSGKTTTASKLARFLAERHGKTPVLVPADVYRPAAVDQLRILGENLGIRVHDTAPGSDPVAVCEEAVSRCSGEGNDVAIIDTAGRLHLDEELMDELGRIKEKVNPHEILLVADAMTGQDAVTVSEGFNDKLDIDGVVLTKMDADARGGAALSIKATTGKPIKFFGTGEKSDALEVFHPERIASRILGMGDVLSLIEKAETAFEEEKTKKLAERIAKKQFSLEDYRESMAAMNKLGPLENIAGMVPGMKKMADSPGAMEAARKEIGRSLAIIGSMTPEERKNHAILNGSRRKRIARGSGTRVQDVNRTIKNYIQMRNMMKNMGKMGKIAKRMMNFG